MVAGEEGVGDGPAAEVGGAGVKLVIEFMYLLSLLDLWWIVLNVRWRYRIGEKHVDLIEFYSSLYK